MNWLFAYAVVGIAVAAAASVLSDRFHTKAGLAAVIAGLLWPIVLIGAAQVALWTAAVKLMRRTPSAPDAAPATLVARADVPPL